MTTAQRFAREIETLRRRVTSVERASQGNRRSIEGGALTVFDTDGQVRATVGVQSDGTVAVATTNDPVPPTPSAAIVFPTPGGLEITWDGTFSGGAARTADTRCVNVHAAPGTTPFIPGAATIRASLIGRGTVTVDLPAGDPYTVILVAETTGGTTSAASVPATETPASAAGADQQARDLAAAAQDRADQAVADAAAAQQAAQAAQSSAAAVTGDVATAQQAADDANAQAQAALQAAQGAASTGTSAQQAANLAKSAADAAQQAANSAGTAASTADAKAADAAAKAAQAIADAATASGTASSALTSANGKVRYFTSATAPAYSGDADTAVWIDTANGRRLNRWSGTAWETQQFGNLALQPGSIVASDVLVQGSISAALLKADAIDGKTITGATFRTAASGQRVTLDSTNGLRGFGADGTTVKTQVGTDGKLTATGATITGVIQTADSGPRLKLTQTVPASGATATGQVAFMGESDSSAPPTITGSSGLWGSSLDLENGAGGGIVFSYAEGPAGGRQNAAQVNADVLYLPANTYFGNKPRPGNYFAQVKQVGTQPLTSGQWTSLVFTSEDYDTANFHDNATNPSRFTAPVDGVYEVTGFAVFGLNDTGRRGLRWNWAYTSTTAASVVSNGVGAMAAARGVVGVPATPHLFSMLAGGWIEMQAFQDCGATLSTFVGSSGTGAATPVDSQTYMVIKLLQPL